MENSRFSYIALESARYRTRMSIQVRFLVLCLAGTSGSLDIGIERRIWTRGDPKNQGDQRFGMPPELHSVEQRIQVVRKDAISPVLWVSVMSGMVARSLEDPKAMKGGDKGAVFFRTAVCPAVEFIAEGPKRAKEPQLPRDAERQGRRDEDDGTKNRGDDVAMPKWAPDKITRLVMMNDVWSDNIFAKKGSLLGRVRVLEPVEDAGKEIDEDDNGDNLNGGEENFIHGRRIGNV
jgi:hypothetical protein